MSQLAFSALCQKPEMRPRTGNPTTDSGSWGQTCPKPLLTYKQLTFFKKSVSHCQAYPSINIRKERN